MSSQSPIGIFDSGFGGLSVTRAIRDLLPGEDICYVADCGYAPWGDRSDDFINARVDAIVNFMFERHVKAVVIACNTATAVAAQRLRAKTDCPIIGIEPAVMLAARETKNGHIGVIATTKTIESDSYRRLCNRTDKHVHIVDQACPGLMDCVEAGETQAPETISLLHKFLDPMLLENIDTLVLGCTHYPFLQDSIRQVVGNIRLIDPSPAVARQLRRKLVEAGLLSNKKAGGIEEFYSTDATPARERILETLWGTKARLQNAVF